MKAHCPAGLIAKATKTKNLSVNPNYTGPTLETVLSSITVRSDSIGYLDTYEPLREEVKSAKIKFAHKFYRALANQGRSLDEKWVEACKKRYKELYSMMSKIVCSDPNLQIIVVSGSMKNPAKNCYDPNTLRYIPSKGKIIGFDEMQELLDIFVIEDYPKIFASLFIAMLHVSLAARDCKYSDEATFKNLADLCNSIIEIAGLFNETSPDEKHWRKQEDDTYKLLTGSPETKTNDPVVRAAFQQVLRDIRYSNLPYVSEIQAAIRATKKYRSSQYSDKDYYFSLKADPVKIPGVKIRQSLIKSMVETDPLRGCSFDKAVGYQSHYNVDPMPGASDIWISTIHIPNPGKYKTRAIHLAMAAIQDRCCYIHNRLYAVLIRIPSDCTKDQMKGVRFALKVSNPDYRESHDWCSVLEYDWSNATDKLDPEFQEECLRLLFPDEVIELWHTLSSCWKEFRFKDGTSQKYQQKMGQPQGLLGSFDAFAWAHHIIMLITMRMSGLQDEKASDFYRVLGDDSIISSIHHDPANIVGDNYIKACAFANLDIERSKSTEVLDTNRVALVSFAKVYVLDGQYFSPIPERIANRIGSKNGDYYAITAALWHSNHGFSKASWLMDLIDHYYPDSIDNRLAKKMIKSGLIKTFSDAGLSDPSNYLEDCESWLLSVCFYINKVKSSMLGGLLGDALKENLDLLDVTTDLDSLEVLCPKSVQNLFDRIEDPEHKFMIALEQNLDKEDTIKAILNCTTQQAEVLAVGLQLTDEEFQTIKQVLEIFDLIKEDPESVLLFKSDIRSWSQKLEPLERLNYRSLYKRTSLDVMVFRRTIFLFKQIFPDYLKSDSCNREEGDLTL